MTTLTPIAPGVEINLVRQHKLKATLHRSQMAAQYFFVDIVGNCNLKCPSCPMGQEHLIKPKGTMDIEKFRRILDKIERECEGQSVFVDLYNWTEPLLHPDVAAFVREVKKRHMGCGISTNLNISANLRDLIKAGPDYIRVSLSGYDNPVYQTTHAGGDVNVVKSNLYLLRHLLDKYRQNTVVTVGFHIYRGNFPNDFMKMLRLCDELELLFEPTLARLMPVEAVIDMMDGKETAFSKDLVANLVATPTRWKDIYDEEGLAWSDCQFRQVRTTVNFDGTVSQCCAVFDNDHVIAEDFEDISLDEIAALKYENSYCSTCMAHKTHMMYTGCLPDKLHEEAGEILGPQYQQWRSTIKFLGSPTHIVMDGTLVPVQEAYDRGIALLNLGEAGYEAADKIFLALTDMAPNFGEGFFQGARLAMALGRGQEAMTLISRAVELSPDHQGYREEENKIMQNQGQASP